MKTRVRSVDANGIVYETLMFACPGCIAGGPDGYDGIHTLPVNTKEEIGKPVWTWDGNREAPTLSPSILTHGSENGLYSRCHSFLRNGVFEFLTDSTHPLAGQKVPIPDLPEWVEQLK